jgi:hypothetical protein
VTDARFAGIVTVGFMSLGQAAEAMSLSSWSFSFFISLSEPCTSTMFEGCSSFMN